MIIQNVASKFKNKYRIASARLAGFDYSNTGLYFVTICTRERKCMFGNVQQGIMNLSAIGEIVKNELLKTMKIRPNVNIDEWVIMPNHLHVIVGIDNQINETHWNGHLSAVSVETPRGGVSVCNGVSTRSKFGPLKFETCVSLTNCISEGQNVSVRKYVTNQSQTNQLKTSPNLPETPPRGVSTETWKKNCLGSIINQFKGACSKRLKNAGIINFSWQPRFHDHIIRNDKSLENIRQYILENPEKWQEDELYVAV